MIDNLMMWYVHGLGTSNRTIWKLVHQFGVYVLAISEPFQNVENLQRWASSLDFPHVFSNLKLGGKIWLCCKDDIFVDIVATINQCIIALLSGQNGSMLVSFVYA